ncbi:MAG: outer membrane lipoprotein carrier protein LolA [Thermonemataceae bacterium]
MKKMYLLALILVSVSSQAIYAQSASEKKAQEILTRLEQKYKEAKTIRAYFAYEMTNTVNNVKEEVKGEFVMKDDMYRLKLLDQEIINNGKTMWTYLKETNEVNVTDYNPEADDITPDKVFSLYKQDYRANFIEEVVERGKVYQVVDLQPNDKSKKFYKIRLKINKNLNAIKSWEIFEKNQNRFKYTISEIDYDVAVGDGYFSFDPDKYPDDIDIVDLR